MPMPCEKHPEHNVIGYRPASGYRDIGVCVLCVEEQGLAFPAPTAERDTWGIYNARAVSEHPDCASMGPHFESPRPENCDDTQRLDYLAARPDMWPALKMLVVSGVAIREAIDDAIKYEPRLRQHPYDPYAAFAPQHLIFLPELPIGVPIAPPPRYSYLNPPPANITEVAENVFPRLPDGACHWEINGHIAQATDDCEHVPPVLASQPHKIEDYPPPPSSFVMLNETIALVGNLSDEGTAFNELHYPDGNIGRFAQHGGQFIGWVCGNHPAGLEIAYPATTEKCEVCARPRPEME